LGSECWLCKFQGLAVIDIDFVYTLNTCRDQSLVLVLIEAPVMGKIRVLLLKYLKYFTKYSGKKVSKIVF